MPRFHVFSLSQCSSVLSEPILNTVLWWLCSVVHADGCLPPVLLLRSPGPHLFRFFICLFLFACSPVTNSSPSSFLFTLLLKLLENLTISQFYFVLGKAHSGISYTPAEKCTACFPGNHKCPPIAPFRTDPVNSLDFSPVSDSPFPSFQVFLVPGFTVLVLVTLQPFLEKGHRAMSLSNLPTWLRVWQPGGEF